MNRFLGIATRGEIRVWLTLSLLLGAQGVAQWHLVAERHGVCAAHGELVDSPDHHASESHTASTSAADSPGAGSSNQKSGTADHHCAIAASLVRAARQEDPPNFQGVLTVAPLEGTSPALAILPPQVTLFRIAPKNSPPSA
jgi:hypothetical protein